MRRYCPPFLLALPRLVRQHPWLTLGVMILGGVLAWETFAPTVPRASRVATAAVPTLRPTVIYGERDRLFTPRVIRAMRLPLVPRIGPGTNRLSCVYAGNVAAAAVAALDAPLQGFRAYNVTGDGPPALSQRDRASALQNLVPEGSHRFRIALAACFARQ